MTTQVKAKNQPGTPTQMSPEAIRQQLLRPIPQITAGGLLVILVVILVLSWSWQASQPNEINLRGKPPLVAMADLISRMLPPEFDLVPETRVTYNILGNQVELGWPVIIADILVTIQMAIMGTLGAVVLSLPLSLLAARNISPHPLIYQVMRLILNFMRSIPELVWALLFVAAFGLGPFPGVLALVFGSVGSLTRVYAEAIEQINPQQVMAVRATGANSLQTFIYAVIPQALSLLISYSIVFFESNVRHATILGLVGAGGIGLKLSLYSGMGDYQKLLGTALVLVVAVTVIDRFSSYLRQRFI
jgi:phosphonate transport system permease protein